MKNFLFLICFCLGCSDVEEKPLSGGDISDKGMQVVDEIVYSDEKERGYTVLHTSNWGNFW